VVAIGAIFRLRFLSPTARKPHRSCSNVCAPMSGESIWYLDSSAIVKLVAVERETPALSAFLAERSPLISSALAITEVLRAVLPLGETFRRQAEEVLKRIELVRLSSEILREAGQLEPATLRSLDAIHLATAGVFGTTLRGVVTYDERMGQAADSLGWAVHAPS
jgi:uncharacterized protein